MTEKKDIRIQSQEDIIAFFEQIGEKTFRAKQVYQWLWEKSCTNFEEMTNLSQATRDLLNKHYYFAPLQIDEQQKSNDRTIKTRFKLHDGELIEGVLIPSKTRMTACVSSQSGCSLSCKFCATGYMGLKRNLTSAEIYNQVAQIKQQAEENYGESLSNIVYMGMGEPLLNYKNVLQSIEHITSPQGLGMSPSRITVSTAGIAKMIKKLGDDNVRFNLALSLHAANDEKRSKMMPINDTNNLEALTEALQYFYEKTGNRITLEYIVFDNFNDTLQDAEDLYQFAKKVPSKVNIIEYNPIAFNDLINAKKDKFEAFVDYLDNKNLIVNVRRSRGKDIDAACGQLTVKKKD